MFNRCQVSMSNSTLRNYGEAQPLSHQWSMMAGWSYCGLKTSFLNFMLEKMRFKLRKGSSFSLHLSFERAKVTSPTPYFSTSSQSDRRRDSPSLNCMTTSSEPSFLVDLSVMEMRESMAKIAIQFSESTRNLICLGSMKYTRKMLAFSLELKSTLSRVVKSPLMHLTPLICSYISKRILIQFDQYYQQKESRICICTGQCQ